MLLVLLWLRFLEARVRYPRRHAIPQRYNGSEGFEMSVSIVFPRCYPNLVTWLELSCHMTFDSTQYAGAMRRELAPLFLVLISTFKLAVSSLMLSTIGWSFGGRPNEA